MSSKLSGWTPKYYTGQSKRPNPDRAIEELPYADVIRETAPEGYVAEPGLVNAADVAVTLGMPLLLTGDPGTGKTTFADSLALGLGMGKALKFETKSDTEGQHLFYRFNELAYFYDGKQRRDRSAKEYLHYNAVGKAILNALPLSEVEDLLPKGFEHPGHPRQSVVVIDEVDKAPREMPNDILNEIVEMSFRIPELENRTVCAPKTMRPIIVLTSNSERQLPDAFLRRCVYYHIAPPTSDTLTRIINNRLGAETFDDDQVKDAIDVFKRLTHKASGMEKTPGTGELISWLRSLRAQGIGRGQSLKTIPELVTQSALIVMAKKKIDRAAAEAVIKEWLDVKKPEAATA